MVKGKVSNELSRDDILSKITSYDIYRYYFGDFKLNRTIPNHLRKEKMPSLVIGTKVGHDITHKDFGDASWRGDCFSLVMSIFGCDFPTALRIIDRDFGLGLSSQPKVVTSSIISWPAPKISKPKPPLLQIITRRFTKEELGYWEGMGLSYEDVKDADIFVPKQIWRNKTRIPLGKELTFCYWYNEIERWKIYRPNASKRDMSTPPQLWKWDSSVPFDYCDGLDWGDESCSFSFLTKSRKDRMVLRKALGVRCVADVQAEDPACIKDSTLSYFLSHSDTQVTVFDNDKKGKDSSWWLTNHHSFKHCNVPDKYNKEGITDFADLARVYGLEEVRKHFKQKGFI